jgi:hypothetical protein
LTKNATNSKVLGRCVGCRLLIIQIGTGKEPPMKLPSGFVYPVAVALFFGGAVTVHADVITWSYQWDRSPLAVGAGTGGVGFTNENLAHAAGPSDIVATNLSVFSSANPATPDFISSGGYSLKLTLTDDASHAQGIFTFTGQLGGTISSASAQVTNTFTNATTQAQTLGGNLYTVTIGPYTAPGPPMSTNLGAIAAHVDVRAGSTPSTQSNPEPSTLLLGGLGTAFLGFISLSQWRRKVVPIPL